MAFFEGFLDLAHARCTSSNTLCEVLSLTWFGPEWGGPKTHIRHAGGRSSMG
jgi:hypothetical protein